MNLFDEKRKLADRRIRNDGPPASLRERRKMVDRREIAIAEISFAEWVMHVVRFQQSHVLREAANSAHAMGMHMKSA